MFQKPYTPNSFAETLWPTIPLTDPSFTFLVKPQCRKKREKENNGERHLSSLVKAHRRCPTAPTRSCRIVIEPKPPNRHHCLRSANSKLKSTVEPRQHIISVDTASLISSSSLHSNSREDCSFPFHSQLCTEVETTKSYFSRVHLLTRQLGLCLG